MGVLILLMSLVIFGIGVGAEPTPQPVRQPIYEAFVSLDDADLYTASLVGGNIVYAASCEQSDVQAAINSASDGDTVVVPAGSCTWSASVSVPNSKKITLQGAGIDSTVINKSPSGTAVHTNQSGSRVTGFTFNEGYVLTDGDGWRVDHCKFYHSGPSSSAGVYVRGVRSSAAHPTGLVDNCSFYNTKVLVIGTAAMLHEDDRQHILWTHSLDLGTNNNVVYVEDCNFEFDVFGNAIDTNYGGAYVFRFNHISHVYIECHSVQSNNRATRRWEIYGNTIDNPGSSIYFPYRLRGGTGVVFNDTIVGTWTFYGIALDNVRSYADCGYGGFCDGNSTWDGNEDATGYPCRDQIGRGPDNPQWDHNLPAGAYTQPLVPAYAWENRRQSNNALVPFQVINSGQDHIKPNRDYYNHNETFNGTSGVGVGLYADMSATCTTGVAYWATDQGEWNSENPGTDGQLYKCTAPDTWELYYIPYTYPHPLTSTDSTPPSRSNGQPTGTLSPGTTLTIISLTTDETATCKYSTTPNTAYASMANTFSTTGTTFHSTTVSGLENGGRYTYYVRCEDAASNANPDDYPITFSVAEPLVLHGAPADETIYLSWTVNTTLPVTSTWRLAYDGPTGDQPSPISNIISPTRAYTLTGLTNYHWYTVTLNAMLNSTPFLTDTVTVMPTDIFVYLPLVLR